MSEPPYRYSPLPERPSLEWPGGRKLAFYIGLNIEHYVLGQPSTSISALGLNPDPMNHAWRDYGTRVGIWRMIDLLDQLGMPASALINSAVCSEYPQIIAAGKQRGWAWVAHGITNSQFWTGFNEAEEIKLLDQMTANITQSTGCRPKGWLGPAFSETPATSRLLADRQYSYTLNWAADDQPFALSLPNRRFICVPYSAELNDISAFLLARWTPEQFAAVIIDHFECLRAEARAGKASVMPLCLHPFISNVPFRHVHLEKVLRHINSCDDVWITTSDAIANHYLTHYYPHA